MTPQAPARPSAVFMWIFPAALRLGFAAFTPVPSSVITRVGHLRESWTNARYRWRRTPVRRVLLRIHSPNHGVRSSVRDRDAALVRASLASRFTARGRRPVDALSPLLTILLPFPRSENEPPPVRGWPPSPTCEAVSAAVHEERGVVRTADPVLSVADTPTKERDHRSLIARNAVVRGVRAPATLRSSQLGALGPSRLRSNTDVRC